MTDTTENTIIPTSVGPLTATLNVDKDAVKVHVDKADESTNTINNITIINEAPKPAVHHHGHHHAAQHKPATPKESRWILPPGETVRQSVQYDAEGNKVTRFTTPDYSAEAIITEGKGPGNVTLQLMDERGSLVTHGDRRGFLSRGLDVSTIESSAPTIDFLGYARDTVSCQAGAVHVTPSVDEQVTREKLQTFAAAHPGLAEALRGTKMPVTLVGGLPASFSEALAAPSNFRACPSERRDEGIAVERLR